MKKKAVTNGFIQDIKKKAKSEFLAEAANQKKEAKKRPTDGFSGTHSICF